uniref:Cupin-like domain-containing protein n=2 Tax=Lotharella globosa TaxID=91324 RepID=A0A7S4DU73_9EUKA|mmetsp:Transcript_2546/g.4974  ORF Transcript_2546/g.4974 Transcript_2546/m.4974 type:complete len:233 (+) Transcript_2546:360-1058(+)
MMSGCSDAARRSGDCAGDATAELTVESLLTAARKNQDPVVVSRDGETAKKSVDRNLYFSAAIDVGTDGFVEATYSNPPLSWIPSTQYDNLRLRLGLGALQYRAHFDGLDNYVIQVDGTKLFILLHPQERKYIYPLRNEPRRSRVDFRNPKIKRNPKFSKARGFWHRLLPGDVLFLPKSWWHYVESEDPRESSRNGYWLTLTRHAGQLRGDGMVTFCAGGGAAAKAVLETSSA